MVWEIEHSISVDTSLKKAWEFHINIEENWKAIEGDSVEYIKLDGPYITGTKGMTKMKGQPPTGWSLIEVIPLFKSVTEFLLPDAKIHFVFTFIRLSNKQTKLTQKITLSGSKATQYIPMMKENFGHNLEAGMKKIATEMAKYGKDN